MEKRPLQAANTVINKNPWEAEKRRKKDFFRQNRDYLCFIWISLTSYNITIKYLTWFKRSSNNNVITCPQSSLLGDSIKARMLWWVVVFLRFRIFWMTGIVNAAVLPDPVRALISTSLPSSNRGIAVSWIRVGSDHASWETAWKFIVM